MISKNVPYNASEEDILRNPFFIIAFMFENKLTNSIIIFFPSSSLSTFVLISDSEDDDCVIIDELKQTSATIVPDYSDIENGQPRVRLRSPSPIPTTSGYKPPRLLYQSFDE